MFGTTTSQSSSNDFWPESTNSTFSSKNQAISKKQREDTLIKEFLSSVDEAPDFHDPYSDLNLFLSQKIKQEIDPSSFSKKWSLKIQEELIQKITPEFQKKFPQYRLGVTALRKSWEKLAYYSQQLQHQKEALTQDGKLNIHFFIKENLRQYPSLKSPSDLHPHHYAHQLAVKLSECIAAIDGVRPKLDQLTKTVWAVQRHLLPGSILGNYKSPYDEYDKIDKLIVKTILEITAKEPQISQQELEHKVTDIIQSLHDLPSFASLDAMTCNISALLAEKLYATSSFHTALLSEEQQATINFIRRQTSLCKTSTPSPQLSDLIRRTTALFALACQLPKTLTQEEIQAAVDAMYPIAKAERPQLPQSIFAFISAELVLMKNEEYCHSKEYVIDAIYQAYQETKYLPQLLSKEVDLLEIVIWKTLSEKEGLLEKLPYRIGQRIEEEIANILIDNPHHSFCGIVHLTVQFFQRLKELSLYKKWSDIERKIHMWTIQGDMLCRCIRLDQDTPLLKLITGMLKKSQSLSHFAFVNEVCQTFLRKYPNLALYTPQLIVRIWILYKYTWYTLLSNAEESSFDRFLKWHCFQLQAQAPQLGTKQILQQLEALCKKTVSLLPFDVVSVQHVLGLPKVEEQPESNKGNAQVLAHI